MTTPVPTGEGLEALLRAVRLAETVMADGAGSQATVHALALEFTEVHPADLVVGLAYLVALLATDLAVRDEETAADVLARVRRVFLATTSE